MAKLKRSFFERDTLTVARELLGCFLVREIRGRRVRARIIETEAYIGEDDLACHASKGRTKRTELMYGEAGHAYVYLVYGMHELFNIVTESKEFPAAVLIRALVMETPLMALKGAGSAAKERKTSPRPRALRSDTYGKTNGPGKLTRALGITRKLNGEDLTISKSMWLEFGTPSIHEAIFPMKRIGIDYAKHCREYPWRFVLMPKKPRDKG